MLDSINATYGFMRKAIDIANVFKNTENKEKVIELIDALSEAKMMIAPMQEMLLNKDAQISELKEQLKIKKTLIYKAPSYYLKLEDGKNDGPFCQVCHDKDKKLIRLHPYHSVYGEDLKFICKVCDKFFYSKN